MTFVKFYKKTAIFNAKFQTSSKILVYEKLLGPGKTWRLNRALNYEQSEVECFGKTIVILLFLQTTPRQMLYKVF